MGLSMNGCSYRSSILGLSCILLSVCLIGSLLVAADLATGPEQLSSLWDVYRRVVKTREKVAVCLVGSLGQFQLTGPSIEKYLVSSFDRPDVFVVSVQDNNAYKLYMLRNAPVVAVRMYKESEVPEDWMLQSGWAGVSRDGVEISEGRLLKTFAETESCVELIQAQESKMRFKYDWIVRARPDGLWSDHLPPLLQLRSGAFYIPYGSDGQGINTRFAMSTRNASMRAMTWLSSVPSLLASLQGHISAEETFEALLSLENILGLVDREMDFPFCTLTSRRFPAHSTKGSGSYVAVAAVGTRDAKNGVFCWPCEPVANAGQGNTELSQYCTTSGRDWPPGWEAIFDSAVKEDLASARRDFLATRNFFSCNKRLAKFMQRVETQEGGFSALALCTSAFKGGNGQAQGFVTIESSGGATVERKEPSPAAKLLRAAFEEAARVREEAGETRRGNGEHRRH